MQCPRCFFENPADARWCGYCGHAFDRGEPGAGGAEQQPAGRGADRAAERPGGRQAVGRSARKHDTHLGIHPQDDPFEAVAISLRGGSAASEDKPAPPPPPVPRPGAAAPAAPPASPKRRPRPHQDTVVEGLLDEEAPPRAEIVGVLLCIAEGGEATPHVLRAGSIRIGRDADNDLVLDDPRVSAHHAVLRADPGTAYLLDTSTNGTLVNGTRVRADRASLADGAVIELDRTVLAVQLFAEDTLGVLRGVVP